MFFKHWAKTSKENGGDPELQWYLHYGEMRERAHSVAFRKRVMELSGEDPYPDPFPEGVPVQKSDEKRMAIVGNPNLSDKVKFEKLKSTGESPTLKQGVKDLFCNMFTREKDHDLESGRLLGWFIAEERQTERDSAEEYARLVARSKL